MLVTCLQQTLKLRGFSLHEMTDEKCCSAGGLAQLQVCGADVVELILQDDALIQGDTRPFL